MSGRLNPDISALSPTGEKPASRYSVSRRADEMDRDPLASFDDPGWSSDLTCENVTLIWAVHLGYVGLGEAERLVQLYVCSSIRQ